MLNNTFSPAPLGGHVTQLDDDALASVVGGGPLATFLREVGTLLWVCVKEGLDDVIAAAEEGYQDARTT